MLRNSDAKKAGCVLSATRLATLLSGMKQQWRMNRITRIVMNKRIGLARRLRQQQNCEPFRLCARKVRP